MADILDGSGSESEVEFKINEDYAKSYNRWKGKEEFQKLKDRYGDGNRNDDDSSSSSESEVEDLTNVIDKQFLTTLGCLKSNDPRIYNANELFYSHKESSTEKVAKKKKKDKPMYISDYKRKVLLEKNGVLSDEDEDEEPTKRSLSPTYDQELQSIKNSFKSALQESDEDEDVDKLLSKRCQTKQEKEKEEQEYIRWLKGEVQEAGDTDDLAKLKSYWSDPKLDSGEAFLRDYILNKRFLDSEDTGTEHPTYEQLVEGLSEDEDELEVQATFEHKFNFRFEEPDEQFIKSYPRTMENSLRRKDDRRKKRREELKIKKQEEKEKRREELNRLKSLKRSEILERLESLKEITGASADTFDENDLEGDFNPEEHDKKMQAVFNEEYYADVEGEIQKPKFAPDEELDTENWDEWQGNDDQGGVFNMDAEWDGNSCPPGSSRSYSFQDEMLDASRRKKKRRRSRFAQALTHQKPTFDPDEKSYEEYLDEYYKLDYEDMIGDQPVRFPYRKVPANDFGLTTEEILIAKDKELNRWCSLKKTMQYRTDEEEKYDLQAFKKKAQNENKKMKLIPSLYQVEEDQQENPESKKKMVKSKNLPSKNLDNEPSDDRLRAFGINPKKHKNKIKYGKKT